MRKKRADQTPSKTAKLLTVLAVLMAVIMLIFLGRMVSELHRVFARDPYSIIDYDLQQGDYAGMVTEYYHRGFDVAPFSGVREEEYYIAQYADAAPVRPAARWRPSQVTSTACWRASRSILKARRIRSGLHPHEKAEGFRPRFFR